jgi:hypothetical protein
MGASHHVGMFMIVQMHLHSYVAFAMAGTIWVGSDEIKAFYESNGFDKAYHKIFLHRWGICGILHNNFLFKLLYNYQ